MSTTTSKRPSADTVRVLFEDQIERVQRESFERGRKVDPESPYTSAPPVAIHDKHLAVRIADEVGVTHATGMRYLDSHLNGNVDDLDLVSIECDANTGEVVKVMGVSPLTLIAHLDTQRLHVRTQVHLSFDGFLLPPGEHANTYARGGRNRGTFAYVAALEAISDIFRERSTVHYEAENEHIEAEAAREADFDQAHPGLREALTRICEGDDEELDALRNGNHFFVADRRGEPSLAMSLTADGIVRLSKALGL